MLKYLSRMRRKQDLNKKAITLSKRLTTKLVESRRVAPVTHTWAIFLFAAIYSIRRRCGLTNDTVPYCTVRYRYCTVLCDCCSTVPYVGTVRRYHTYLDILRSSVCSCSKFFKYNPFILGPVSEQSLSRQTRIRVLYRKEIRNPKQFYAISHCWLRI